MIPRGDSQKITIGSRTNIQDLAVLHVDKDYTLSIGDNVTIGHSAIVHGCTVGKNVLIGMGAIVMNGAKVEKVIKSLLTFNIHRYRCILTLKRYRCIIITSEPI